MTATALAALSLAIWVYLIAFRGGFWRTAERDDALAALTANGTLSPSPRTRGEAESRQRPGEGAAQDETFPDTPPHPRPARFKPDKGPEALSPHPGRGDGAPLPAVTAVIPARNEAEVLGATVGSLLRQSYAGRFAIVVVDDQSTDGTAEAARGVAGAEDASDRLTIIRGADRPSGWTGKLWAMRQGLAHAEAQAEPPTFILFTDADIVYDAADTLERLARGSLAQDTVLTSLMVKLRCESLAERLLIPAFVFFFQKLYPFAWVNDPANRTAAAAGGCMLVRREALQAAGGLDAIRGALIDDCALGRLMKGQGPIWLGLTERRAQHPRLSACRRYPQHGGPHGLCGAALRAAAARRRGRRHGPDLSCASSPHHLWRMARAQAMAAAAWALMTLSFLPMLRFYRRDAALGRGAAGDRRALRGVHDRLGVAAPARPRRRLERALSGASDRRSAKSA